MDARSEAASLSVQEAMKILNMKKFTAEELNAKFQYRVQSITRGLGGSLESQKSVYTAWEYLNRMLARETSNQIEEVLKKVDKTANVLEKPKQFDVIPVRLDDTSKKVSLIIQKDTEGERRKPRKHDVRRNAHKKKADKTEEEKRMDPERSLGVSALPGQLFQKHIKWIDELKSKPRGKEVEKTVESKNWDKKGALVRLTNAAQKRPKKDSTMTRLKETVTSLGLKGIERTVRSGAEDETATEKREELAKLLEKLPKLPRTQSQAHLFKKTTALNGLFENPRKPSKYDLWSSSKKTAWKERAEEVLSERPGSTKRPKTGAKIKSRKAPRRSISKQPVEQVLYKKRNSEAAEIGRLPRQIKDLPPRDSTPMDNPSFLARGPFTPSRILKWIKSTHAQDIGT